MELIYMLKLQRLYQSFYISCKSVFGRFCIIEKQQRTWKSKPKYRNNERRTSTQDLRVQTKRMIEITIYFSQLLIRRDTQHKVLLITIFIPQVSRKVEKSHDLTPFPLFILYPQSAYLHQHSLTNGTTFSNIIQVIGFDHISILNLGLWTSADKQDLPKYLQQSSFDIDYAKRKLLYLCYYQQYPRVQPAMGQTEPGSASKNESLTITPSKKYEPDIHTIEMENILPSTFSHQIQKIINEVESISRNIEEHSLERYLISSIDQRFSKYNKIDSELFHSAKNNGSYISIDSSAFLSNHWEELRSKESFFKVMVHFHKCYHVEMKLKEEYQKLIRSFDKKIELTSEAAFETLRKPSLREIDVSRQMDQGLIMRLIFYYYIKTIKLNVNTHSSNLCKFHSETGSMLCQLILCQYLQLQQLFELLYELVCMDKLPSSQLKSIIAKIHRQYNGMCLKNSYSINESKERMRVIGTATRIYLDELYLKSLEQAQDPDIKNTDDALMPIKVFPISRVKDKQKN